MATPTRTKGQRSLNLLVRIDAMTVMTMPTIQIGMLWGLAWVEVHPSWDKTVGENPEMDEALTSAQK
jgi:hypothetical protein